MQDMVHWHEGQFLQQHCLQRWQRWQLDSQAAERRLAMSYPYGLLDMQISLDALDNGLIRFERLRAVMPCGLLVDYPGNCELPSVDIKQQASQGSGGFVIRLAVPVWQAARANTIELRADADYRSKRLWRLVESEVTDENDGENPQPMLLRRINARLLLPDEDPSDLDHLALIRVLHGVGEDVGKARLDPSFSGPCLVMEGSASLRRILGDLANQVSASREELVTQLTRGGFTMENLRGVQFEQLLRLRTLNVYAGRLLTLARTPAVAPLEVYLELRSLLGELAALQPAKDPFRAPDYLHDEPLLVFSDLADRIRELLRGAVSANYLSIPFVFNKVNDLHFAELSDEHLSQPVDYFLAIRTKQDSREVASLVENEDSFKLIARSYVEDKNNMALIRGVVLREERHAPLELPARAGQYYFRLMRGDSKRMWEAVRRDKQLALVWPGQEASDFECILYMTLPG